jgi:glucose-1-phosphate cytidylyltransferase
MKVVILAGGLGSRLSEETSIIPKPMVEIGGHPILWHIMKIYSYYGFNDFIILTGYKSHVIKDYFINYYTRYCDISIDMSNNSIEIHKIRQENWKVTLLYTGQETMTGGRLLYAKEIIGNERFMLTYGDGLSDVDIPSLISFHNKQKSYVTVTGVRPVGKFGSLMLDTNEEKVICFNEKSESKDYWINGGFFVMEPKIFDYLKGGDETILERFPLEELSKEGKLTVFKHKGFWHAMDTLRDKTELTQMWLSGMHPWALWLKKEKNNNIKFGC